MAGGVPASAEWISCWTISRTDSRSGADTAAAVDEVDAPRSAADTAAGSPSGEAIGENDQSSEIESQVESQIELPIASSRQLTDHEATS